MAGLDPAIQNKILGICLLPWMGGSRPPMENYQAAVVAPMLGASSE